jgi:SAM-dependent methyltransferase
VKGMHPESRAVLERYARRTRVYSPLDPAVYLSRQELERALIRWLRTKAPAQADCLRLLEVGCGSGGNLLQLLRLGFRPGNLTGNELQADLLDQARAQLPAAVDLMSGDAVELNLADEAFDVVFQSLVFSSLLDAEYRQALADRLWRLVVPGGGVLWYDFVYDNPGNPDVRGIKMKEVRMLFPLARITAWRVTLAPPLSRAVVRLHPGLYSVCNALPWLRTHRLCWLEKPAAGTGAP